MLSKNESQKHSYSKLGIAFIALIILQSYLVPLIAKVSGTDYSKYVNYVYFSTIISYAIIISSIIILSGNGINVFRDYFSLGIIVLTCFFRANLGGNNEFNYKGILIFLGLILLVHIIAKSKNYPNTQSQVCSYWNLLVDWYWLWRVSFLGYCFN